MGNLKCRLYVGNLNFKTTEKDLTDLFSEYGSVVEVRLVMDREDRNRFLGYAFVELANETEADAALVLHDELFMSRPLIVNKAKPPARSR